MITANAEIIKTLIQYGVLGIIALLYLRHTEQQQKSIADNFQKMLNDILDKNDAEFLSTLLETLQAHNSSTVKFFEEIKTTINVKCNTNKMLVDMITDYNDLIKELKTAVIKIKNNNSRTHTQSDKLIALLLEEKYITQKQLEYCRTKLSAEDLDILDNVSTKTNEIIQDNKDAEKEKDDEK